MTGWKLAGLETSHWMDQTLPSSLLANQTVKQRSSPVIFIQTCVDMRLPGAGSHKSNPNPSRCSQIDEHPPKLRSSRTPSWTGLRTGRPLPVCLYRSTQVRRARIRQPCSLPHTSRQRHDPPRG